MPAMPSESAFIPLVAASCSNHMYLKIIAVAGVYALGAWSALHLARRVLVQQPVSEREPKYLFV